MLAVVGDLVEDVVVWPLAAVTAGTDNRCAVHRTRGGSAANVAAMAAPLVATRFVGCVGDDRAGEGLERALAAAGVEVCVQRRGRTGCVVVIVDPSGERTMFPDRAAAADLDHDALRWANGVAVLHVPAYAFESGATAATVVEMAAAVHADGGRVSVDASAVSLIERLGARAFAAHVAALCPALLFANRDEATALSDGDVARDCTIVVKDGPRPATVHRPGRHPRSVPAEHVEDVRDTTGAGDAFAAGTLAAWIAGADVVSACSAGHRLAASVLAVPRRGRRAIATNIDGGLRAPARRPPGPRSTPVRNLPFAVSRRGGDRHRRAAGRSSRSSRRSSPPRPADPHNREALPVAPRPSGRAARCRR